MFYNRNSNFHSGISQKIALSLWYFHDCAIIRALVVRKNNSIDADRNSLFTKQNSNIVSINCNIVSIHLSTSICIAEQTIATMYQLPKHLN